VITRELYLGNLEAIRDWVYAPEYVEGMWMMLQHQKPDDYVLATNTGYTVRQLVQFAFETVGLDHEKYVKKDERYFRPTEVDALIGDYSKARNTLGWTPKRLTPELAKLMVNHEVNKRRN